MQFLHTFCTLGNFYGSVMIRRLLHILLLLAPAIAGAQDGSRKQVKLVHADNIYFDKKIVDAQRLVGHVHLIHDGTTFLCDSAWLYANQNFDAFGNIRVDKPGVYSMTGGKLFFNHEKQLLRVEQRVVLRDGDMTLTADQLIYNRQTEVAHYSTGGRIVSTKNSNILTSKKGAYHARSKTFYFREKVKLENPEYVVLCDTLQYREPTEVAYFFGPTTITSKETKIYCENGWYDTRGDVSQFNENAQITSDKTILKGDSIYYNGKQGYGEVFRNVSVRDTTSNVVITGQYGRHTEATKTSVVTRKALMIQVSESDSLFLAADTLMATPDSMEKQFIRAFHRVRIFRSDLQGRADSLTYSETDSLLVMFRDPVLWSDENQVTGDTIRIRMWDGKIDGLEVRGNAFILNEAIPPQKRGVGERRYNQIKGRNLTGRFRDNALVRVKVEGNGQLVYFPTEEKGDTARLVGHNQGESSDIDIAIENNQIIRINLIREPDSVFSPLQLADASAFELKGFRWRGEERPERMKLHD